MFVRLEGIGGTHDTRMDGVGRMLGGFLVLCIGKAASWEMEFDGEGAVSVRSREAGQPSAAVVHLDSVGQNCILHRCYRNVTGNFGSLVPGL